jgi:hypothetical protein
MQLRWWSPRSWTHRDRLSIGIILGVPVLLFVLPALAGHPAISGDNLLQNYPLRVLTGQQIAAGHWPLWNPFADSGTPLLGGMNAGSLYPGTLLFVFVPALSAWVLNLLLVYWVAGLGLYALSRWLGFSEVASVLAAVTYAFGGAMVGQLVHIAVVQGQSWLPWLVLCQLLLGRELLGVNDAEGWRSHIRRALPGVLGLAFVVGMIFLTAEPRSIADGEMVAIIVAGVELLTHGGARVVTLAGRIVFLLANAVGVTWGVLLSLIELYPGWGFIKLSERSSISYTFFGSGSLSVRWTPLLLVQGLLGGNGVAGTPSFFGSYNLAEVTGYVGLLALTAAFAFGVQLARRRSDADRRTLVVFFILAVCGLLLTWGSMTPLGHLFHMVPLFGKTRLQSRNLAIFDLGAAVLLAWFVDAVARGRAEEASLTGRARFVTLIPVGATALLSAVALITPGTIVAFLDNQSSAVAVASDIRTAVVVSLVVSVAYLVVLLRRPSRSQMGARALVLVAVLDLVTFNILYQSSLISGLSGPVPNVTAAQALLGTTGRSAIVDPGNGNYHQTAPLGLGNINVFTGIPSVQGYGSLVSERYSNVTGTRSIASLDGCALASGRFRQLRLATIAISQAGLISPPGAFGPNFSCGPIKRATSAVRYFGTMTTVDSITFAGPEGGAVSKVAPSVHLLGVRGQVLRVRTVLKGSSALHAIFPTHPSASAVVVTGAHGFRLASTIVTMPGGRQIWANSEMQYGLNSDGWHFRGVVGELSLFRTTRIAPTVWLSPRAMHATATVAASSSSGTLTVDVATLTPTMLIRSEAWLPGWVARVAPLGGQRPLPSPVVPVGLIQGVHLPAGLWSVEFSYHAPHLRAGIISTTASSFVLLVGVGWLVVDSRRRRRADDHDARSRAAAT